MIDTHKLLEEKKEEERQAEKLLSTPVKQKKQEDITMINPLEKTPEESKEEILAKSETANKLLNNLALSEKKNKTEKVSIIHFFYYLYIINVFLF